MKIEEIQREAAEIEREIQSEETNEPSWNFFKLILGVFLVTILVLWAFPYTGLKHNPEPGPVPFLEPDPNLNFTSERMETLMDIYDLRVSPTTRRAAITITSESCSNSDICYAKALFYYVRDRVQYLSDPPYEYIQSPEETLLGAGDCEDQAILLIMLMKSIGIRTRMAIIPGHAYVEIYLPEAPNRYKDDNGWIVLDPTCRSCEFGEIPRQNIGAKKQTISI
jgi:transglutaminase-like putative cysteine protease